MNIFRYEEDLIQIFISHIENGNGNFNFSNIIREFNYNNGKTDILGLSSEKKLYAFEAKLTKWKYAVNQAYRNTIFANYSYVVMPERLDMTVLKNIHFFEKRNVGLILVDHNSYRLVINAQRLESKRNWISDKANKLISREHEKVPTYC